MSNYHRGEPEDLKPARVYLDSERAKFKCRTMADRWSSGHSVAYEQPLNTYIKYHFLEHGKTGLYDYSRLKTIISNEMKITSQKGSISDPCLQHTFASVHEFNNISMCCIPQINYYLNVIAGSFLVI